MKGRALGRLVRQNVARGRRAFVLSVFGITVGIASLTFFLALSSGVRRVVRRVFPAGQLEVVPSASTLGAGGALSVFNLGGPKPLTDEAVDELKKEEGVRAAYRRMRLAFPARAYGGAQLLGRDIHAELVAEGVDSEAMADESLGPRPFADVPPDCSQPIPAVLSPFLLELYNGAIAPSHGLPKVGRLLAGRFRGFTFTAELGQSFFGTRGAARSEPRACPIMLVGIASHAAQLAVTLPLSVVRAWNTEYAGEAAGRELSSVTLELSDEADVARIAARVRELGYTVSDSGAERVGVALTLLTLLFALVSIAIVAVAAVNIAHSFFRAVAERKREIGVLRALGASAGDVQRILLAEAAAIGLCGGVVGLLVARLCALAVDAASARFVPDFPFKPDSYFAFDWPIILGAISCAVIACMAGALLPARAAARLDPSEALSSP